jgi:hypothetical protein
MALRIEIECHHTSTQEQIMRTFRNYRHTLAVLVFAGISGNALAESFTGKVSSYQIYTNSNGDNYSVKIGPYNFSAARANAELLREAFFRKLTVNVSFTPTTCFINPPCGYISSVYLQSADLP